MRLLDDQRDEIGYRECRCCGGWTTRRQGVCVSCMLDHADEYADHKIQDAMDRKGEQ